MRKLILAVVMLLSVSAFANETWDTLISNPNFSVNSNYDFSSGKILPGAATSILSWKGIIDAQMGWAKNDSDTLPTSGICINLDKIDGINVQYLLKDQLKISFGLWAGMNLNTHNWAGGINLSVLKIDTKK